MSIVYLSLGSNIGDRKQMLENALFELGKNNIEILQVSPIYETKAWGEEHQNDFLNQALEVQTELQPEELLQTIKDIEEILGRTKREKWREREIDIDMLFYDDANIDTKDLIVPHPLVQDRMFVLIPLCDIAEDFEHPILKKSIKTLKNECTVTEESVKQFGV